MATKHSESSDTGSQNEIDFRIGGPRDGFPKGFNSTSTRRFEKIMSHTEFEAISDMAGQPSVCQRDSHPFDRLVPANGDNFKRSCCSRDKQGKDGRCFL